jgi:ubiquinone/menaquinone biosynthesis C-methylase UbiE
MAWWPFRRRGARANSGGGAAIAATRTVRGRRFAAGVPYVLPKDMQEVNRLDFQHYMLRQVRRGNSDAPITQPRDVLDVGTGTGRWALEMALTWPQANVIGLDIVPPPIDAGAAAQDIRPPNYAFVPGNILEGLPFSEASFDYVHQRMLVGAIPRDRWSGVVQELVRVTRPGGWIELIEAGSARGGGPALEALNTWGITAAAQRGIDIAMGANIGALLQTTGMTNITAREVLIPLGKRGGRVGLMMEANYFSALENIRPLILAQGLTDEATHVATLAAARREAAERRCSVTYYVAYAQRPTATR